MHFVASWLKGNEEFIWVILIALVVIAVVVTILRGYKKGDSDFLGTDNDDDWDFL